MAVLEPSLGLHEVRHVILQGLSALAPKPNEEQLKVIRQLRQRVVAKATVQPNEHRLECVRRRQLLHAEVFHQVLGLSCEHGHYVEDRL